MNAPSSLLCTVSLSLLLACGSSSPPPAESAASTSEPAADAPPPAAENEPAPASGAGDEGWEGEKEATGSGAGKSGGDAKPPGDAKPAPDTKGEETRTIEVLSKMVKEKRQPVRDCYDKARKDLPDLKGDMVIHFVLDPEGKVKLAELNVERSTLKSPPVADCAIKVIKSIPFPPSSRGMDTEVNYPYNLNPK